MAIKKSLFAGRPLALTAILVLATSPYASAADPYGGKEVDQFDTGLGPLEILFFGHASLGFEFQ